MKALLLTTAILLLVAVTAKSPVNVPQNLSQSAEVGPEFKLVLLALLPHGFETNEMQLDAGEYMFIVGNRTGLKEVNIRFGREGEKPLATPTLGGRSRDWKQRLKLTPGDYVISASENPDWTCRIIVRR